MRLVYLDEAGISAQEPVTIVAGIIVHADSQWIPAQRLATQLLQTYVPEELREGFVFHAKDLYSGGKTLDQFGWSPATRAEIFESLLRAPRELHLDVVIAFNKRHPQSEGWLPKNEMFFRHCVAFVECVKTANACIKSLYPGEVASIIVEDHAEMRRWLRDTLRLLKEPSAPSFFAGSVPFDAIIDPIHFVAKKEAALLQIADACAFAARRFLAGLQNGDRFFKILSHPADTGQIFPDASCGAVILHWPPAAEPTSLSPLAGRGLG